MCNIRNVKALLLPNLKDNIGKLINIRSCLSIGIKHSTKPNIQDFMEYILPLTPLPKIESKFKRVKINQKVDEKISNNATSKLPTPNNPQNENKLLAPFINILNHTLFKDNNQESFNDINCQIFLGLQPPSSIKLNFNDNFHLHQIFKYKSSLHKIYREKHVTNMKPNSQILPRKTNKKMKKDVTLPNFY
ncbi:unnamed protein product [Gordionus sp. m RMFG-2023]